jgi:hypothetical protein
MTTVTKVVAAHRHCINGMSHVAKCKQFRLVNFERRRLPLRTKMLSRDTAIGVFYPAGLIRYDCLTRV